MAELIGVVGKTGTGKSTSIKNLDPATTFIINVASKPLPFKGWKKKYTKMNKDCSEGNYVATSNHEVIRKLVKIISARRPEIKVIVLEDSSYIMSFEIFDRAKENSYTKQVEIAQHYADTLRAAHDLRDDLMLIVLTHPDVEKDTFGDTTEMKMKTYGKMTDKYMSLDGLFTYVLFTKVLPLNPDEDINEDSEFRYVFQTNDHSKISTAKTPEGVFEEKYIDNDLSIVVDKINRYNDGDDEDEEETETKQLESEDEDDDV